MIDLQISIQVLFLKLEGNYKADCSQFRDAVVNVKHSTYEESLSGVKAKINHKPQELATKKMQAVKKKAMGAEPDAEAPSFSVDYKATTNGALNQFQQEHATWKNEQRSTRAG